MRAYRELVVDEAMGACSIRRAPYQRLMPDKPITRGWKFWVLADAKTGCMVDLYLDDHTLRTEHTNALPEKFGGAMLLQVSPGPVGWGLI